MSVKFFLNSASRLPFYEYTPLSGESIQITYLATTGFVVKSSTRTVVFDPFLSRPKNLFSYLRRPLITNKTLIKKYIPEADDVVIGHSHFDHILDSPELCQRTGARLIGSSSTKVVAQSAVKHPDFEIIEVNGKMKIPCGSAMLTSLPSEHGIIKTPLSIGKLLKIEPVPYPGHIKEKIPWPPFTNDLKVGDVFDWLLEIEGVKFMHIDSSNFKPSEYDGLKADVVCLCAANYQNKKNYVREILTKLEPSIIIPCHWDYPFSPVEKDLKQLPKWLLDLELFIEQINHFKMPGAEIVLLPFNGKIGI